LAVPPILTVGNVEMQLNTDKLSRPGDGAVRGDVR
jgi:hypothetical protein